MRLSDARLRRRQTKLVYPDYRLPPWLTEDANPRDRSNRLLDARPHWLQLGPSDVEAFLTHLAVKEHVSASTQNQALQALLFLHRHVLEIDQ
jgi:hypothetical protein